MVQEISKFLSWFCRHNKESSAVFAERSKLAMKLSPHHLNVRPAALNYVADILLENI